MKFAKSLLVLAIMMVASFSIAQANTARLQVIHNAADPAAASVDIYVNGSLFLNDFAFRAATPFVDVPAGVTLNIGVAPGSSDSADDVLATIPVMLETGKTYVAIANGVLDPNAFAANPDNKMIGFNLYAKDRVRESSRFDNYVEFFVFHGATDAPTVDLRLRDTYSRMLVDSLSYGEFSPYKIVKPKKYFVDLFVSGPRKMKVASYEADLSGLGGGAAVVFASGFLTPSANQNGPAFGIFAALPNGTVVEFPVKVETARLQVIHNAADPAAVSVDIYVNGSLFLNDFAFRAATPFVDVPAGVTLNIGVAPGSSASADDILATIPVMLEAGKTYVAMANGVLNPDAFAANPDERSIGFTLFAKDGFKEQTRFGLLVGLTAFHGATDAPAVDIRVRGKWRSWTLFGDLAYGDFSGFRMIFPGEYTLDITPAGNKDLVVASFKANLSGLGGATAVVFASGFLTPTANQNGPAFGLFAALPNGTVVELPALGNDLVATAKTTDDVTLPQNFSLGQNYPNPFNPATTISFALPVASEVSLAVYNTLGQTVKTVDFGGLEAGVHQIQFDGNNLPSGIYFYRLNAGSFSETKKMMLVK